MFYEICFLLFLFIDYYGVKYDLFCDIHPNWPDVYSSLNMTLIIYIFFFFFLQLLLPLFFVLLILCACTNRTKSVYHSGYISLISETFQPALPAALGNLSNA